VYDIGQTKLQCTLVLLLTLDLLETSSEDSWMTWTTSARARLAAAKRFSMLVVCAFACKQTHVV